MAATLKGTSDDDSLWGSKLDEILKGLSGDDELHGRGGDDNLSGGSGDDSLYGGAGDDVLSGGSGDDLLRGGAGDDELSGGSGDDSLFGGSGDDVLKGGSGDDLLRGGEGDDKLFGGSGDDILVGGAGDDELTGGSGDDVFRFSGDFGDDVITDLKSNDTIDLTAFSAITDVSELTITEENGDTIIEVPGADGAITVRGMSAAEVMSLIEVACLGRGTLVRTPKGEMPVEALAIGDLVLTQDGQAVAIKWIGRRAYARPFIAASERIAPIHIRAGAFGPELPSLDLYVSPEHAILVDDILVPARLLVDGSAVTQMRDLDRIDYFHLEFDVPQVIFANGVPTESYVERDNRRMFANYRDYVDLYGESIAAVAQHRRYPLAETAAIIDVAGWRAGGELRLAS
jgi:hypothetical protein